jgi:hypothetical protein
LRMPVPCTSSSLAFSSFSGSAPGRPRLRRTMPLRRAMYLPSPTHARPVAGGLVVSRCC